MCRAHSSANATPQYRQTSWRSLKGLRKEDGAPVKEEEGLMEAAVWVAASTVGASLIAWVLKARASVEQEVAIVAQEEAAETEDQTRARCLPLMECVFLYYADRSVGFSGTSSISSEYY